MNTNPRCPRCKGPTYGAGWWCPAHGDGFDLGNDLYVEPTTQPQAYHQSATYTCEDCKGPKSSPYSRRCLSCAKKHEQAYGRRVRA